MKKWSFSSLVNNSTISRNTLILFAILFTILLVPLSFVGAVTGNLLLPVIPLAALVLVFAVLIEPLIGILALVALLPFNGLISQMLGNGAGSVGFGALKDLILVLLLVSAVRKRKWRNLRVDIVILVSIIVVFSLISALWSSGFLAAAYGWRNDFEPLLLLLTVPVLLDRISILRVSTLMTAMAQLSSAVSVITWSIGLPWLNIIGRLPVAPGESFPSSLFTARSTYPRAFSPYVAPNEMAVAIVIVVAVIWSRRDWKFATRAILTILPAAAVVLSSSRSGQIGLVLVFGALIFRWLFLKRPRLAFGFLGGGAILGVVGVVFYMVQQFATRVDPSLLGHASSIDRAVQVIISNPLGIGLGNVGPRALRYVESPYTVESFWLLLALESGIVAMLAFVILLVRICIIGIRAKESMGFLAVTAIIGSLVSQLVLPTLQDGPVSFTLWIAVSLGLASARFAQEDRSL